MTVIKLLLRSRKFWLAVVAVVQTILFQYVPEFPKEVWLSINALLGVLIATIAAEDFAEKSALKFYSSNEECPPDTEG
mgnify:CR=1 FL=1